MALQLNTTMATGVTANYYRVIRGSVDLILNIGSVDVALYLDQASRDAGKEPLTIKSYMWKGEDNPFTLQAMQSTSIVTLAYDKLKTLPEYSGSLDV